MRSKAIVIVLTFLIMATSFAAIPKTTSALTSGDFGYSLINNGTAAEIISYAGSDSVVTVPDFIDGYQVVSIGSYGLSYSYTMTKVVVPEGVTNIGDAAFYQCSSLSSVTLPNSLVTIGNGAFYDCLSLKSIDLPTNLTTIQDYAFYACDLSSVDIPASITTLGGSVFADCHSLSSVNLSNGLTTIGSGEFSSCYNLASISIPESITSIGAGAFYDCESLTSINIPDNVTTIGNSAFQNCTGLKAVDLGNGTAEIDYAAFYHCSSLGSIYIPDSVITLGYGAFYGCTHLTSVTLDHNLTSIAALTFCGCSSLTNITVPDSVTSISYGAFFDCTDLSSIHIGTGVSDIGASAMGNCTALISMVFDSIAPSVASDWVINHDQNLMVYFRPGASGFTTPSWQGVPSELTGTVLAAPQMNRVSPGSGSVELSWKALTGNGSEGIDYYIVYQDGADVKHVVSGNTATITGLVNGQTYSFQVAAHGPNGTGLGSTSFRTVPFTGIGPLSVTITSPMEGVYLPSGDVNVTWTIGGDMTNASYSEIMIDDAPPVLLSETDLWYEIHGLGEGSHTVNITLFDAENNLTTAKVTFTVDITAPSVLEISPTGNGTSTRTTVMVKFSEKMDQYGTSIVLRGMTGTIGWNGSIATFTPLSTLIGNTTYTVMVNGRDLSGNPLTSINWTFTTANVGTILGRVLDANNFPIVGAKVTLTRTSSVLPGTEGQNDVGSASLVSRETQSDARGNYVFYDVALGNYTLTSSKAGYNQTTANIGLTAQAIAAGGITLNESISPQAAVGNDYSIMLILVIVVIAVLILLAIGWKKRRK